MTLDNMKNEVRVYCLNLILNSNVEDWVKYIMIKDNIKIEINKGYTNIFSAKIYTDNTLYIFDSDVDFRIDWCWNKKERTERHKINQKFKEIDLYLMNKQEYENTVKTYNLLPIKELRRNKLKSININEEI